MKILMISPNYKEKAWMISAKTTAEALVKYGKHDVTVITSNVGNFPKEEVINGVLVKRNKTFFIPDPFNLAIVPGFKRIAWNEYKNNKNNYDAIIFNKYMFWTTLASFKFKREKVPFIIQTDTFPGLNWKNNSKLMNILLYWINKFIGIRMLRNASKVVILHEGNIPTAKKIKINYQVIHNGIDPDNYKNLKEPTDIIKVKENKLLVTWVGRLDSVKQPEVFLEIAEKAWNNPLLKDKLKFLIICGDKYPVKRKKLAEKYPYIHFEAYRTDVPEIFKATNINILTSKTEGLPNTVIEAMAAGCTIISKDVGGVKALIKFKGDNNSLFEETDEVIKILEKWVINPKKKQTLKESGEKNQEQIKKNYNLKNIAKDWSLLLTKLKKD